MSMRELPNAGALSEFVSGYNGDCGECAELCLLHTLDASRFPLDADALRAITGRDVSHGWASPNGAEPLSSIAHDLDVVGVKYTNDGFSQPASFDWRGALANIGGVRPLVFEVALALNLPGDESGVHYHFITCLGWDAANNVGLFADGDNELVRAGKSGPSGIVSYTLAQLDAAQICGLLICDETPAPLPPPPAPAPTGYRAYTVVRGDSLSEIAAKLHIGTGWYHGLYQPNMATIEAAARRAGHPNSDGGNLIFPGEVLHYQA